jgi:hypothetical protein
MRPPLREFVSPHAHCCCRHAGEGACATLAGLFRFGQDDNSISEHFARLNRCVPRAAYD